MLSGCSKSDNRVVLQYASWGSKSEIDILKPILKDFENHLNIYVYAPYEARLHNCIHELMMNEKTARRMIKEVDTARENYQKRYCPEVSGIYDHKDIMINSSSFGVD